MEDQIIHSLSFTLRIATADQEIDSFTKLARCAYAWTLIDDETTEAIGQGTSAAKPPRQGRHTDELVSGLAEALQKVELNSTVYIVSDVSFFVKLLNDGTGSRVASGYKRKDKRPLAYEEDWRRLDTLIAEKHLRIWAGGPRNEAEARDFQGLKGWAKKCARNIGRSWSDWDVR